MGRGARLWQKQVTSYGGRYEVHGRSPSSTRQVETRRLASSSCFNHHTTAKKKQVLASQAYAVHVHMYSLGRAYCSNGHAGLRGDADIGQCKQNTRHHASNTCRQLANDAISAIVQFTKSSPCSLFPVSSWKFPVVLLRIPYLVTNRRSTFRRHDCTPQPVF